MDWVPKLREKNIVPPKGEAACCLHREKGSADPIIVVVQYSVKEAWLAKSVRTRRAAPGSAVYEHGVGNSRDLDEAKRLYALAAAQGLQCANANLQRLSDAP